VILSQNTGCEPREQGEPLPPLQELRVDDAGSVMAVAVVPSHGCPSTEMRSHWARGTLHASSVTGNEHWTLEGSPHRFPNGVHLLAGATVTIAPCAVVLVGSGRDIVVQNDARLRAEGVANRPVLFSSLSEDPHAGDWAGIELRERTLPNTVFCHTIVEYAGAKTTVREPGAAIRSSQTHGLDVREVIVQHTQGFGIALLGKYGFSSTSVGLTVRDTIDNLPVFFADVDAVRTLPSGDYSHNDAKDIWISARERVVKTSGTWRDPGQGVRYRVRRAARIMVQGVSNPRLTLAPGVTVALEEDAEFTVGWELPGALMMDGGDAAHRVTLTFAGAPSGAGRWVGLMFGLHADMANSQIRYARIEGAGAVPLSGFTACPVSSDRAGTPLGMIFLVNVTASLSLTNTVFSAGPPRGAAVLWAGNSPTEMADFTSLSQNNDFTSAGVHCAVNAPRVRGLCPVTVGCYGRNSGASRNSTVTGSPTAGRNEFLGARQH
jgi:hypothetical protein